MPPIHWAAAYSDLATVFVCSGLAIYEVCRMRHGKFWSIVSSVAAMHVSFVLCSLGGFVAWEKFLFLEPRNGPWMICTHMAMAAEGAMLVPAGGRLLGVGTPWLWWALSSVLMAVSFVLQLLTRAPESRIYYSRFFASGLAGCGMCWVAFASLLRLCNLVDNRHPAVRILSLKDDSSDGSLSLETRGGRSLYRRDMSDHDSLEESDVDVDEEEIPRCALWLFIASTALAMVGCAALVAVQDVCSDFSACLHGGPALFCDHGLLTSCPFNEHFDEYSLLHITWLIAATGYFRACQILQEDCLVCD